MTPEEAIPRTGADAHNDLLYENIGRGTFPLWFTAKETAEIAKAYAQACLVCEDTCYLGCRHLSNCRDGWRETFKEWSK